MAGTTSSTSAIAPNASVTVEIGGTYPWYLTEAIYRERLAQQLTMQGFTVDRLDVDASFSGDYRAIVIIRTLAISKTSELIARVATAAERAGSYTPTVTIPSIGQPVQAAPGRDLTDDVVDALGAIVRGAGSAVEGAGATVGALPSLTTVLLVGIVVIVGFVAFGPNVPSVARAVR